MSGDVSPQAGQIPVKLLPKSASLNGFLLNHHPDMWQSHFDALIERQGQFNRIILFKRLFNFCACSTLIILNDPSRLENGSLIAKTENGPDEGFKGLEMVSDAVEYMYSRKSIGKVFVTI